MNSHDKFFELLKHYSFLAHFWNQEKRECNVDALDRAMEYFSSGEVVIAKALRSIWTGGGRGQEIDFTDLGTLDVSSRQPLINWLCQPFFP